MRRTVLIVDDHADFRAAARAMLDDEGFAVVGEAIDAAEAVAAARRLRPDVVLLDIQLRGRDGFAVADELALDEAPPAVVLISSRDAVVYGDRVGAAPVRGFLAKRSLSGASLEALLW